MEDLREKGWTNVRTFTGYFLTFMLFPLLVFLVMMLADEVNEIQSFHELLDEKIEINETKLAQTSFIKDRNGKIISELHRPFNRIEIHGDDIPNFLKEILILSEDQHFYEHSGFDVIAIIRALAKNMQASEIEQGASTITQQLARNLYLDHEKTYNRKLKEILYAYQLERNFSKDEILEMYINSIYFSNGAYGIEAAAQTYFQKKAKDLTNAQLAFLAAIPNNPSYYNPVKHFKRTKERQERLIDLLSEKGRILKEEAIQMKKEKIYLSMKKSKNLYPDYTTYVEAELKELVAQSEGYDKKAKKNNDSERKKKWEKKLTERLNEIIASGIIIETSIDPSIQKQAIASVKRHLPYQDIEGAVVIIDHHEHEILAMVGGKNYKNYDFNRAYQAYRQPGSAIKPLLVYAPYIERTNAPLWEKVSAGSLCIKGYCPENYGGSTYGMVSLETAFIRSFNTPAVRLLNKIGVEEAFKDISHFQFEKVTKRDHVLPAAIGGFTYGMSPLEMTRAYTVFANNGAYKPARAIRKVTDLNGNVLYKWEEEEVDVWNGGTVEKVRTLLNKTVLYGTGRKAYVPSTYIGGKTGTTNDYYDYWFIGLTEDITCGVWVGKDSPKSIKYIESKAPNQLIWKDIISSIATQKKIIGSR